MNSYFILSSNFKKTNPTDLNQTYKNDRFEFWATEDSIYRSGNVIIYIDGYIMPRHDIFEEYKNFNQHELIYALYINNKEKFITKIKGFYCLVIVENDTFRVYTDHHSVKRCYYHIHDKDNFVFSNKIKYIVDNNSKLNPYSAVTQALFQHFIGGDTMFEKISYLKSASNFVFNGNFKNELYWDYRNLIDVDRNQVDEHHFLNGFKDIIADYLRFFPSKKCSLTLTGGRDTRSILSGLISLGVKPHSFTFGKPNGTDVITAVNVAKKINLEFSNHYISKLELQGYSNLVEELVSNINPAIHIHRAHRLDAIKREEKISNGIDILFTGFMGGDYIVGAGFDDYIITEFVRRYIFDKKSEVEIIREILDKHFIKYDNNITDFIKSYLKSLSYINRLNYSKESDFGIVYNIIGCNHDIQDINLFLEYSPVVVAPFMDIDIIELLFNSSYSLFSNYKYSTNPYKRLQGGILQSIIIKSLTPELAEVNFANQYTPNDVLGNKTLYLIKRAFNHFIIKNTKPTFTYGEWFQEYVSKNILEIEEDVKQMYQFDRIAKEFKHNKHRDYEGYWHKYSNPIMFSKYFGKLK